MIPGDLLFEHGLQYMHSLNMDIEKMEEDIRQLNAEATVAVAENRGKDDHWQQVKEIKRLYRDALICVHSECLNLKDDLGTEQIKVNTMERVNKLTLQDEQLEAGIANIQRIIKSLDVAARGICRFIG